MPRNLDRDGVLKEPRIEGGCQLHEAVRFTAEDATAAILLLDRLGFDILLFGWTNEFGDEEDGGLRPSNRG